MTRRTATRTPTSCSPCDHWNSPANGHEVKKEYILDKSGQRIKLKNGSFKTRKVDLTDWNDKDKAEVWRQAWADVTNRYLAEQNIPQRIDHRSYERQGIEQIPTVHMGVAATQMERRGIVTEKGGKNRLIREQNRLLKEVRRRIAELGKWVKEKSAQKDNQSINPSHSVPILSQQPPTLLELLNTAMQQAGQPNSRYENTTRPTNRPSRKSRRTMRNATAPNLHCMTERNGI